MVRTRMEYYNIDWALCNERVFKIQQQIAVAWKSGDLKLVSYLQSKQLLLHKICYVQVTHSKSKKLRAVWLEKGDYKE